LRDFKPEVETGSKKILIDKKRRTGMKLSLSLLLMLQSDAVSNAELTFGSADGAG